MRSSVVSAVIFVLAMIAGQARAQEASLPLNVDAVTSPKPQRIPTMVVQETALPVQKAPDAAKPKSAQVKGEAEKKREAEKAKAEKSDAKVTTAPPKPIVLSGAQPAGQSYEGMGTTGNPKYDELIAQSAARNGVDPNLMIAVMRQESGFNPRALSYKGAAGLMQLMPATARRFGVTNIYDPAQNIEGGARYLRFLLDTFNGDVKLVLAGYNAGENAVIRSGYAVPRYRETQNYVRSISARYGANKHLSATQTKTAASGPVAPSAMIVPGGSSGRLSNNY